MIPMMVKWRLYLINLKLIFKLFVEQLKQLKVDSNSDEIKKAPLVSDVIGKALPRIGPYKKLDNTRQVVALIDDVRLNVDKNLIL